MKRLSHVVGIAALMWSGASAGVASPARAATPDPDFAGWVAVAREARANGDLAGALEALERAYALAPDASVMNNIAVTLEELGRFAEALAATRKLSVLPDFPTERRVEVDVRIADLERRARLAWVVVKVDAPDVAWLDDGGRLVAPEARGLEPGLAIFEIVMADGHERARTSVTLEAGKRVALDFTRAEIARRLGVVDVRAVGAGEVTVAGKAWARVGPDAVGRVWLDPGEHTVAAGDERRSIKLRAGEEVHVALAVDRSYVGAGLVGGTGLVAIGVGAALLADADGDRRALGRALDGGEPIEGLSRKDALAREASADRAATAGAISMAVGGAMLIAGIVWLVVDDGETALVVTPGGIAWAW